MVNDVSQDRLRKLAAHRNGAVLSLFLDLDPSKVPTAPARQTAVDNLLSDARQAVEDGALEHDERVRLRAAIAEIAGRLEPSAIPVEGARGLAIFAPGPDEEVEVLRLPAPIPSKVTLDHAPRVEPLIHLADRARWCVALVDRSRARFLVGNEDGFVLDHEIDDETPGQHKQGGWSHGRYQRSIENEVRDHFSNVAHDLAEGLRGGRYDRLVLAGQQTLRGEVKEKLEHDVCERLHGWIELDLSAADPGAVRDAAVPVIQAARREHERAVLARLEQGVGTAGGHGVAGLRSTLGALSERRVETLVVDPTLEAPGSRCPQCGLLGVHLAECPADGTAMEQLDSVIEAAVALAYEQAAEVLLPAPAPQLTAVEGIGAVTRF